MFAQLYTLLLVVITTAAISIPQMEFHDSTLKPISIPQMESHNKTLNRRTLELPGLPQCTDSHYSLLLTSFCKTMTSIKAVCESNVFPGSYQTSDVDCPQDSACVDFTSHYSIPFAICVQNNDILKWSSGYEQQIICTRNITVPLTKNTLTIGLTTYSTNGNPIQVNYMNANIDDNNVGGVSKAHSFSMIYYNYKPGQDISMCLQTDTDQTAIGASAFINGNY